MMFPIPTQPVLVMRMRSTPFVLYTVSGLTFVLTRLSGLALIGSASANEVNSELFKNDLLLLNSLVSSLLFFVYVFF